MQKNTSTTTCWRGIRQTLGLLVLLALLAAGPACGGTDGGLGASGGPGGSSWIPPGSSPSMTSSPTWRPRIFRGCC